MSSRLVLGIIVIAFAIVLGMIGVAIYSCGVK